MRISTFWSATPLWVLKDRCKTIKTLFLTQISRTNLSNRKTYCGTRFIIISTQCTRIKSTNPTWKSRKKKKKRKRRKKRSRRCSRKPTTSLSSWKKTKKNCRCSTNSRTTCWICRTCKQSNLRLDYEENSDQESNFTGTFSKADLPSANQREMVLSEQLKSRAFF